MTRLDMSNVPDEVKDLIARVSPANVIKSKPKLWHVYVHVSKIDGKKYVGMTCRSPKDRWRDSGYVYCPLFWKAIEEQGFDSFEHIVLLSVPSEELAGNLERCFVRFWDTQNPEHGYNIASGGSARWELSDEAEKKRLSKTSGANASFSKAVALFDLSGKRIATFGTITECAEYLGTKRKSFRFNKYGTVMGHLVRFADEVEGVDQLPPEELSYPHAQFKLMRKVNQYDLDGHYITTFPSITSVAAAIGKNTMRLYKALNGGVKTAYGFQWRYADPDGNTDDIAPFVSMRGRTKPVRIDMMDIETGEVLRTFDSIAEACRAIGTQGARTMFYEWMHRYRHQDNIMYGYKWAISPSPGAE